MQRALPRIFMGLLVLVHLGLGAGAIWLPRPQLGPGLEWGHRVSALTGGLVFLIGYAARWRWTPLALTAAYAVMATVSLIATIIQPGPAAGVIRLVLEILTYFVILSFLFHSRLARERFRRGA